MNYSIAIDGPAGAGKSTIAKSVAKQLGYIYVDTGAMYRAMALYFSNNNIDPINTDFTKKEIKNVDISIQYADNEQQVLLNGENVNSLIRTEEVSKMASVVATNKDVRLKLVELQRQLAMKTDLIMDGRDVGTHVLPDANVKIYLTADSRVRAERRWLEMSQKGISCDINEVQKDIIARDEQDMNREYAPLKKAEDAILIDSSYMSIEEVIKEIIDIVKQNRV